MSILVNGLLLGSHILSPVLVVGAVLLKLGILQLLTLKSPSHVHIFVADVVPSFDTVDGGVLNCAWSSLGLPAWFQHVKKFSNMPMLSCD